MQKPFFTKIKPRYSLDSVRSSLEKQIPENTKKHSLVPTKYQVIQANKELIIKLSETMSHNGIRIYLIRNKNLKLCTKTIAKLLNRWGEEEIKVTQVLAVA